MGLVCVSAAHCLVVCGRCCVSSLAASRWPQIIQPVQILQSRRSNPCQDATISSRMVVMFCLSLLTTSSMDSQTHTHTLKFQNATFLQITSVSNFPAFFKYITIWKCIFSITITSLLYSMKYLLCIW